MGGSRSGWFGKRSARPIVDRMECLTLYDLLPGARRRLYGGYLPTTDLGSAFREITRRSMGRHSLTLGEDGRGWLDLPDGQRFRLSSTPQPTGGLRWWMHCPRCDRRCAKLYGSGAFACRVCRALLYRSQLSDRIDRWLDRQELWLRRAGGMAGAEVHHKPPRMHWRTFDARLDRAGATRDAGIRCLLQRVKPAA